MPDGTSTTCRFNLDVCASTLLFVCWDTQSMTKINCLPGHRLRMHRRRVVSMPLRLCCVTHPAVPCTQVSGAGNANKRSFSSLESRLSLVSTNWGRCFCKSGSSVTHASTVAWLRVSRLAIGARAFDFCLLQWNQLYPDRGTMPLVTAVSSMFTIRVSAPRRTAKYNH